VTDPRRHVVHLSDREIGIIERAMKTHASVMRIQTTAPSPREADETARAAAVIQQHLHCDCAGGPSAPTHYRKYAMPIDDRPVIGPESFST